METINQQQIDNKKRRSAEAKNRSWKNFFAKAGGTTIASFEKANQNDQQRRVTLGIVVLVVILFTSLVQSIGWTVPFGPIGLIVGPFWFCIFFYFERMLLQQMDNDKAHWLSDTWLRGERELNATKRSIQIRWLIARFVMILVTSFFASEMLQVMIFKPEIMAEIKTRKETEIKRIGDSLDIQRAAVLDMVLEKQNVRDSAQAELTAYINRYDAKISEVSDSINSWNAKLPYEVRGEGGISGKYGDGPVAKSIRETIRMYEGMRDNWLISRDSAQVNSEPAHTLKKCEQDLESERAFAAKALARIDSTQAFEVRKVENRPMLGLAATISVLHDVASRDWTIWVIFAMFILVEIIPMVLKTVSKLDSFIHEEAKERLRVLKASDQEIKRLMTKAKSNGNGDRKKKEDGDDGKVIPLKRNGGKKTPARKKKK